MPQIELHPTLKQYEAYQALESKNVVYMGGGAGSGKSWLICESRLINAYRFPDYKSFIARDELKRIMQSTFITWVKVCKHHNIPDTDWRLNSKYNYIEFFNGSRVDLLDLAYKPSDPLYERLGSLEYTDGAIEEAGEVNFLAYDVLKSRIGRHMNKEYNIKPNLLITGNPKKNWTYTEFFRPWKDGQLKADYAFIQALYSDNPHTASEYEKQLSSLTDEALKQRLKYGNWDYDDDPAALVDYDAVLDMFTNDHVKKGRKAISSDLALKGRDRFVTGFWEGMICKVVHDEQKMSAKGIQEKLTQLKIQRGVPSSSVIADADGIGSYLESYMNDIVEFRGGGKSSSKSYANLKAQCGFKLAEMINKREIKVICTEVQKERIIKEVTVCLKQDNLFKDESKKKLLPKDKMIDLLGHSPDYLDMLIMGMYPQVREIGNSVYL